jgi:N-acetylneuraminate synthase
VTRVIAEIGSNHNRDLDRCLALVDAAADAGCDAVKVQVYRVDDLFAPQALATKPQLAERRGWELPLEFLPALRARCDERGLELGATPFGLWAVEPVAREAHWLKVASYELLLPDLVRELAATGLPLILSTGMATLPEVASAVTAARGASARDLRLLHCVSGYPTPPEQANLAAIATLRDAFACPVGWSDHTQDVGVVLRAVGAWGASDVELHVDLDRGGFESGAHCWTTDEVGRVVAAIRSRAVDGLPEAAAAAVDGDGLKRPMPVEEPDVAWRADPADGLRPLRRQR